MGDWKSDNAHMALYGERYSVPGTFVGEVREFREHVPVPLLANGMDMPFFPEIRYGNVKRVWDGQQWQRG